jgi:hypothetical protein
MGAISLDLNRERIREITAEAYDHIITALDTKINKTKVSLLSELETILASNRVSVPVFFKLGVESAPDMVLRVDLRRREVFAMSSFKKKQAKVNQYLKTL